ncbi:hypothetical protein [Methylobacter svalbardensis]|uniref:hypothetical protein n=1 Tax=Methylobacter svalbardensis TaxID=3080016 RepID=UPI0030ECF2D2
MIKKHRRIVMITHEEAKYIDDALTLKVVMLVGWTFGNDSTARLHAGGVVLS